MFKRLLVLCVATLVLVGCGSDARITSPRSEKLFTIEGSTVTEQDLFNVMTFNDAGAVILSHAQQVVLDKLVPNDDAFKEAVQKQLEETKEGYGTLWETILNYYGFESDEEYAENVIAPSLQLNKALTNVMTEDFDNMVKDLYVRKAAVLEVSKEDAAAALKALDEGTSWADVAKEFVLDNSSYTGTATIYHKDSSTSVIDTTALSYIISAKENGISEAIDIPNNSTSQYIINVIEVDTAAIKDEIIASFATDSTFQTKYISKLLRDNGFKVFDKDLYDAIIADYPDALAN